MSASASPSRPPIDPPPSQAELDAAGRDYHACYLDYRRGDRSLNEFKAATRRYLDLLQRRADPQALHVLGSLGCRPESDGNGIHRERIAEREGGRPG